MAFMKVSAFETALLFRGDPDVIVGNIFGVVLNSE